MFTSTKRTIFCFISAIFFIHSVHTKSCISDHCMCRTVSNRDFASCEGQNLYSLPLCNKASAQEKYELDQIKVINISDNHFTHLGASFFSKACLNNLQKIYIQQVRLDNIHNDAFNPLTNIVELSLSKNNLRHVPSKALEKLENLRLLDLSANNIADIKNGAFVTLMNLQNLILEGNRISHIDSDAFNGLRSIKVIHLNDNRLITIKSDVFMSLNDLHTLYLENNDWKCNCKMQPLKRMLLLRTHLTIQDNPICSESSLSLNSKNLENFQCSPEIQRNYSDTQVIISEGSKMRLRCATFIETFGDDATDQNYLAHIKIAWSWNGIEIANNSCGADELANQQQRFIIHEDVQYTGDRTKIKLSSLELNSMMPLNGGNYFCNVSNTAGFDNLSFNVRVIQTDSRAVISGEYESRNIIPSASSSSVVSNSRNSNSYSRTKIISGDNGDHILFGLVFGILCGIFIVLVIFSIILVVFFRRQKESVHEGFRHPNELTNVDSGSNDDNHTFDEAVETNTNSTIEKIAMVGGDFNPLLVNPVQKPPRLGIPDVSSLYSHPSWTLDRNNGFGNRSRYASYAETEPLYSDYYTIYRPNRHMVKIDENRTFISDTASEV